MEHSSKNKEIFGSICDLVVKPDFLDGQQEFISQYHSVFDIQDENKLEYTQIYERYVEALERLIEHKLQQDYGYSTDEIKKFVEDFKENKTQYESIDMDTVDLLFGYVDFKTFKKSMLSYVRGLKDVKSTKDEMDAEKLVQDSAGATIEEAF